MESRLRVVASRTSTELYLATAINLLQGDHMVSCRRLSKVAVAMTRSHESGIPRTTLARGLAWFLYIPYVIDVRGVRRRAE